MNVSTQAINLADLAQLTDAPKRIRETAFSMIKAGNVMTDVRTITDPEIEIKGSRFIGGLAAPDWQPLNQNEPTVVRSIPGEFSEQTFGFANAVQIPVLTLRAAKARGKNPADLFNQQVQAFLRGFSYDFNNKFFNNAHVAGITSEVDQDCFVGVRARLMDPDNRYQINSECVINAGGVDMSDSGITSATTNRLIMQMQTLLDNLGDPEGEDTALYLNEDLIRRLEYGIRSLGAGGGFDMTKDAFGRSLLKYRNAPVRRAGRKAPTQTGVQDQVIASTENAAGTSDTGGTFTSIYGIKSGEKDFYIQQNMAMDPTDPYLLENKTHWQVVIMNAYGLVQENTRAIGRIRNIKVA